MAREHAEDRIEELERQLDAARKELERQRHPTQCGRSRGR
eukprot:gene2384-203_t